MVDDLKCPRCGAMLNIEDDHRWCNSCRRPLSSAIQSQLQAMKKAASRTAENKISVPSLPVSTTNDLPGWRIVVHMGLVTAHVVAGTGFFSDFIAGLSDIVGGYSAGYQDQLSSISNEVVCQLCLQASQNGANAIVGLKLDYSEISGKNKSMLMVSASGTAVHAVLENDEARNVLLQQKRMSQQAAPLSRNPG